MEKKSQEKDCCHQYLCSSILPPTGTMSCVDLAPKGSAGGGKKIALYSGRRRPKSQTWGASLKSLQLGSLWDIYIKNITISGAEPAAMYLGANSRKQITFF